MGADEEISNMPLFINDLKLATICVECPAAEFQIILKLHRI